MATTAPTNQDTLVTIKVNIEGSNRRFKLPLRDLGANTLPDKLRFLLAVSPTAETVFERYSDSAAAFIVLDPANTSVYKQLYRAAKAKLKLRLKVTVTEKEPAVVPKPATVEDEEPTADLTPAESSNIADMPEVEAPQETAEVSPLLPTIEASSPDNAFVEPKPFEQSSLPASVAEIQRGFEQLLIKSHRIQSQNLGQSCCRPVLENHPSSMYQTRQAPINPIKTEVPVSHGAGAREKWFSELAGLEARCQGPPPFHPVFSVFCNNCQGSIPDVHYHCSTCDDGDFDLCQSCVAKGVVCGSDDHWMIKRFVKNGKVINSTTERLPPKAKAAPPVTPTSLQAQDSGLIMATRTCNSCIQELPENNFVTCTSCPDFDLCMACHVGMEHGHDPKHAFEPAVEDTNLDVVAKKLLAAGRNVSHNAICDGCDKYIYGVRHKCLDCPDWDYCPACIANASFIHPRHRFVPIYEPLNDVQSMSRSYHSKSRHHGIFCDGPLCTAGAGTQTYIKGDRYKCAVCHDTDFCASCEASPSNAHNRTHPLIKFKTPVRNVNVTTMGDHENGQPMPVMGDRRCTRAISKATETTPAQSSNAATQVHTVADLEPSEPVKAEVTEVEAEKVEEVKVEAKELPTPVKETIKEELVAHFVRDMVADGSVFAPNTLFEQTWYLRNGGNVAWPAGCTVKFVSGDNMCSVDPDHPASVHELISAAESTTCYSEVAPGQEVGFAVLLRTPKRAGTCISYWRLTGPDGNKFGHRLWCDVNVVEPKVKEEPAVEAEPAMEASQMIFPKLEKESPAASIHEATTTAEVDEDEFDDFADAVLEDDETEDGFMTDEEYDILDASDEEYLIEQSKAAKK